MRLNLIQGSGTLGKQQTAMGRYIYVTKSVKLQERKKENEKRGWGTVPEGDEQYLRTATMLVLGLLQVGTMFLQSRPCDPQHFRSY